MDVFIILIVTSLIQGSVSRFSWDTACGVTKGCFPACQDGCEYLVTWTPSGSGVNFELKAEESNTNVYLAIGFSDDYRMGDDSVSACIVPGNQVISTFNEGEESETLSPSDLGLSSASVSHVNGLISCSFARNFTAGSDSRFYNLNNDYILMLVIGELIQDGSNYKLWEHYMIPWSSDKKVDFNSLEIVDLYKLNSPLVKLHGIMMVLAWMLCSTVGILIARYNKDMFDPRKLFGTKYWFQLHRASMIAVLTFSVIGFIAIFVEIEGLSQMTPPTAISITYSHPVFGIIITVLTILNTIAALLRPGGDHQYRRIFNWAHLGTGLFTFAVAVVTLFSGTVTERGMLPDSALYVSVVHVLALIGTVVVMEVHNFKSKNKKEAQVKCVGVQEDGSQVQVEDNSSVNAPSLIPLYVLVGFTLVEFCLTIAVLAIIAAS